MAAPPSTEQERRIAVHEAGHAIVATVLGQPLAQQSVGEVDIKTAVAKHIGSAFLHVVPLYARTFTRDLYAHGFVAAVDTPELDIVFVLSLGTGAEEDDIYNEMRNELGTFVERATIETDLDIDI